MDLNKHKVQKRAHKKHAAPGSVRIIGGIWRGRRLPVPELEGLRPSGDRSRETLFNWLQPYLPGARCADLFAGTGVLGFEAVSRGAASAVLVEISRQAANSIRHSIEALGASSVSIEVADAMSWLERQEENSFDLLFVDPPFGQRMAERLQRKLAGLRCLAPGALAYFESAKTEVPPAPVAGWEQLRDKTLGEVRMQLFKRI